MEGMKSCLKAPTCSVNGQIFPNQSNHSCSVFMFSLCIFESCEGRAAPTSTQVPGAAGF